MTLDETIAEALAAQRGWSSRETWAEFQARRAAAVRSAVCDWLREEVPNEALVEALEAHDDETRLLYDWDTRTVAANVVLTALLSYMEGADRKEGE